MLAITLAALLTVPPVADPGPKPPDLPPPGQTPSVSKFAKVIGWPADKTPTAPKGFTVTRFADGLESPRWLYVLPNGDVLVSQANSTPAKAADPKKVQKQKDSKAIAKVSPDRITLLRDADGDGVPEVRQVFATTGLKQPFGMALLGPTLYVANTDAVVAFPYIPGQVKAEERPRKVLDLPAGGYNHHWTRNLIASPDGSKLLVTVGSGSDHAEHGTANEMLRANVLEVNPDGTALKVLGSGLRNPVGLAFEPKTNTLYTAVNERDQLGDDLVPDYLTSVQPGAFYGWPYSYFGKNEDPRRAGERPDLVAKAVVPDLPLGPHTASLGLAFVTGEAFPAKYRGGAMIGQHGSWNRSTFSGYKVVFVPFKDGKPAGPPEDFLTGFLAGGEEAYGRPVGVAVAKDGALLVTDDAGGVVWRVAPAKTDE